MTYSVFTKAYDEVVRPTDLYSQEELDATSAIFHQLCPVESLEPLKERLALLRRPEVPTAVTLLVDNSGSMRGPSISFATGVVGIISMYLDRLDIPNEILGFTTTSWKGGRPREEWIAQGRPHNPGRLCELRHIVYKSFDEKMDDVRNNLALPFVKYEKKLENGKTHSAIGAVLKENIDGEAVEWACERLRAHHAERRVLLVISDGAPMDDATMGANRDNIFDDHLHQVVSVIRERQDIQLDAIGIQMNVSQYYGVGSRINFIGELAPVAIEKLESLLDDRKVLV